ncbi:hypothetical protein EJ04DRAFT_435103, partial [Polyplosphaeria fusca]
WKAGGDGTTVETMTQWDTLQNIMLANFPQLALSLAFFVWNSHLSVMIAGRDYDGYAAASEGGGEGETGECGPRFGLRVTDPKDGTEQRADYLLTIPFKYWAPVNIVWTTMHWFASQAIFFARVDILSHWLLVTEFSISQVGYSVLGMIGFFSVSLLALIIGVVISCQNLDNKMPLAATCSGALSAACHPQDPSLKHQDKKVHWGVEVTAGGEMMTGGNANGLRRCTFTSLDAYYPCSGQFYA